MGASSLTTPGWNGLLRLYEQRSVHTPSIFVPDYSLVHLYAVILQTGVDRPQEDVKMFLTHSQVPLIKISIHQLAGINVSFCLYDPPPRRTTFKSTRFKHLLEGWKPLGVPVVIILPRSRTWTTLQSLLHPTLHNSEWLPCDRSSAILILASIGAVTDEFRRLLEPWQ